MKKKKKKKKKKKDKEKKRKRKKKMYDAMMPIGKFHSRNSYLDYVKPCFVFGPWENSILVGQCKNCFIYKYITSMHRI